MASNLHDGSMFIEAVAEVPIPVSSQNRALAFYAGTIGLELVGADEIVPGVRRIQLAPGRRLSCRPWPHVLSQCGTVQLRDDLERFAGISAS